MRIVQANVQALCIAAALSLALAGCNKDAPPGGKAGAAPAELPAGLQLSEAPKGAVPVAELKKSAKEGDEVVMRVVVGGRVKPFVDDRAVMTVVDAGMDNACTKPGDSCKTPWDFCCAAPEDLKLQTATVQFTNAQGRPLALNLNAVAKVKPLSVLVIKGTVGPRPDAAALVVNATGLFVESNP